MRQMILSLTALLIATAILYAGNGLQGTLMAIRADGEGFAFTLIGLLMSAYFVGFIVGCRTVPRIVSDVGHIRTFTALASVASASALAHAIFIDPVVWIILRIVTGFCFAGLAMVLESWINERATNDTRGQILSIYRIIDFGALTVGQLLLTLASPMDFTLFAVVSILVSLALVPVALTRTAAPQPISRVEFRLRSLFELSPLAFAGSTMAGLANTAFWALGAVFAQRSGYGTEIVATFMSVTIVGGALAQWPIGLLSDRIDRRYVIIGTSVMASVAGLLMFLLSDQSAVLMLIGGALFGAFAMPLFGLAIAHANDYGDADSYVEINSGLLLMYGVGAVAGPVLSSWVMGIIGGTGLFAFTMAVHLLMAGFGIYRMTARSSLASEDKEDFSMLATGASMPNSTPEAFALDPKLDETIEGAEAGPAAPSSV